MFIGDCMNDFLIWKIIMYSVYKMYLVIGICELGNNVFLSSLII